MDEWKTNTETRKTRDMAFLIITGTFQKLLKSNHYTGISVYEGLLLYFNIQK